ncbi:MAG: hopanoid biosynthesis-associated protein HpnK [Verrucomicrobiota bacterium]|nr:hopanoid biosynthesis-associated protein HpnK [Verrucomicrobiota bacterium]
MNADDFGRSSSINAAVVRAHRQGILTSASLMVNENAFAEAVQLAKENPQLGIGLHLTLLGGLSTLTAEKIPGLVDSKNQFSNHPVNAGFRYFFSGNLRSQLRAEMAAQFEKFHSTGLKLDHVNGHINIHLHPVIFKLLIENAVAWGIRHMRLTCDPLGLNARLAVGQWAYRLRHYFIYRSLSNWARPILRQNNIRFTQQVFGLLQSGRINEEFLSRLLGQLPEGDSELYSHPSLDDFKDELDALTSPAIKNLCEKNNIKLIRYQDLT